MLAQRARPTIARPPLSVRQVSRRQPQLPQRPKRCMAALQEGRRVIALFKRLRMPRRLHRRGMKFEEARDVAVVTPEPPTPPSTVHHELEPSAGHQRKDAIEVRIERARLFCRPPRQRASHPVGISLAMPSACDPSPSTGWARRSDPMPPTAATALKTLKPSCEISSERMRMRAEKSMENTLWLELGREGLGSSWSRARGSHLAQP